MTSGLKPIEAETRDLFKRPLYAQELKRVDALVFDPPRQGAEAQARELAKSAVPVVVAVSCNAATFALYKYWAFEAAEFGDWRRQYLKQLVIFGGSLLLNTAIPSLLHYHFKIESVTAFTVVRRGARIVG